MPRLTFAYDRCSGFPAVRVGKHYVALLPLTKLQVERYVWCGQAARDREALKLLPAEQIPIGAPSPSAPSDPEQYRELLLELLHPEAIESHCGRVAGGRYDLAARRSSDPQAPTLEGTYHRQPLGREVAEEAVLATNLNFAVPDHNFEQGGAVPQPWTPPERIGRWLNGDVPLERVVPSRSEYATIEANFARWTAAELLQLALEHLPGCSDIAKRLLRSLLTRTRFHNEKSLPFLSRGVWEVTSELRAKFVFASRETGPVCRPLAVGTSDALPVLAPEPDGHFLLIERHPAIGFRPLLELSAVDGVFTIDSPVLPALRIAPKENAQ